MNEETTEASLLYHEQIADGGHSLKRDLIFMKLGSIRSRCPQPLPMQRQNCVEDRAAKGCIT